MACWCHAWAQIQIIKDNMTGKSKGYGSLVALQTPRQCSSKFDPGQLHLNPALVVRKSNGEIQLQSANKFVDRWSGEPWLHSNENNSLGFRCTPTWTGQPLMYHNMVPYQGCNPCSSVVTPHLFQVVLNLLVESPRLHQVCGNLWRWEGLKETRDLCAGAGVCFVRVWGGQSMEGPQQGWLIWRPLLSMAWYEVIIPAVPRFHPIVVSSNFLCGGPWTALRSVAASVAWWHLCNAIRPCTVNCGTHTLPSNPR